MKKLPVSLTLKMALKMTKKGIVSAIYLLARWLGAASDLAKSFPILISILEVKDSYKGGGMLWSIPNTNKHMCYLTEI